MEQIIIETTKTLYKALEASYSEVNKYFGEWSVIEERVDRVTGVLEISVTVNIKNSAAAFALGRIYQKNINQL